VALTPLDPVTASAPLALPDPTRRQMELADVKIVPQVSMLTASARLFATPVPLAAMRAAALPIAPLVRLVAMLLRMVLHLALNARSAKTPWVRQVPLSVPIASLANTKESPAVATVTIVNQAPTLLRQDCPPALHVRPGLLLLIVLPLLALIARLVSTDLERATSTVSPVLVAPSLARRAKTAATIVMPASSLPLKA